MGNMRKIRTDDPKYRHELKYYCRDAEMTAIEQKLRYIMRPDDHADANGEYLIRSVYFDDYRHGCFHENEDGVDPRAKFRLRVYNYSHARISLEKKKKRNNITGKDSCLIDEETCRRMLHGEKINDRIGYHPLLDEWIISNNTVRLKPVMLGEYLRKPLIYPLGNVRITFDRYIVASAQTERLFDRDISKIAVLPTGYHILEVKYDDFLPDVIYRLIENGHLLQTTFSKFYLGSKALGGQINELSGYL